MSESVGIWIQKVLNSSTQSKLLAEKALEHLSSTKRRDLLAIEQSIQKNIAFGQWFEATVYETLAESVENTNYRIVNKGPDVLKKDRSYSQLGQEGLFYDEIGAIVARGNGQDLAEFDILVLGEQNEAAFVEAKTSNNYLKEFDQNINFKRKLLEKLFKRHIDFIFVSPQFCKENKILKNLHHNPDTYFAKVSVDQVSLTANLNIVRHSAQERKNSVSLNALKTKSLNYSSLHNHIRKKIITSALQSMNAEFIEDSWLIKRAIIGNLSEKSWRDLLLKKDLNLNGQKLTFENSNFITNAILAIRMPNLRPEFYLRLKDKKIYFKMGPKTLSAFEFERNIRKTRTAFFDWLEQTKPIVETDVVSKILTQFLTVQNIGSRKKQGEHPDLRIRIDKET